MRDGDEMRRNPPACACDNHNSALPVPALSEVAQPRAAERAGARTGDSSVLRGVAVAAVARGALDAHAPSASLSARHSADSTSAADERGAMRAQSVSVIGVGLGQNEKR